MLKKCLVGCLAVSSLLFTAVNAYNYSQYEQNLVNRMSGEWKNLEGQVVFNIQNGYLNGAQVLDVTKLAGYSKLYMKRQGIVHYLWDLLF